MGASHFLVSSDEPAMSSDAGSLDLVIDTVSAAHQASAYMRLLAKKGTLVMLGVFTEPPHRIDQTFLIFSQTRLAGSMIGTVADNQVWKIHIA